MNYLQIIFLATVCICCSGIDENEQVDLNRIMNCNVEIFTGIRMESRDFKQGKYRVPYFSKELKGQNYLLPNFSYFDCHVGDITCLRKISDKDFDVLPFAKDNGVTEREEAHKFTSNYIEEVLSAFDCVSVYKIISDSKIGECVIFYLDKQQCLIFCQDTSKVVNPYWINKMTKESEIAKYWYRVNIL